MKAMILAAGRGKRMRPLTDHTPKPLLKVAGQSLIEYHIKALVKAGIKQIIINHAWLGEQIVKQLGDGSRYNCQLIYSSEPVDAYETAGGIIKALGLLTQPSNHNATSLSDDHLAFEQVNNQSFIVINGDIWCDYPLEQLTQMILPPSIQAHLILVDNPLHNPNGDFSLEQGLISKPSTQTLTFSGIGLYKTNLFTNYQNETGYQTGPLGLGTVLRQALLQNVISGEYFQGQWSDIGTPERLKQLQQQLTGNSLID